MRTVMDQACEEKLHQSDDMDMTAAASPALPQQTEASGSGEQQTLKVYLRVRPFSKDELYDGEDQDCVVMENSQTATLTAPKGSATMKSSERGIGMSIHKFTFSQIFGPETSQSELYQDTVQSQMSDFLEGGNALIFSYGVTNAGKTFTIQGTPKDPGILPRVLDETFHHMGSEQYERMDMKPYLRNDVQRLDPDQVRQEKGAKAAIFASVKEESDPLRSSSGSASSPCTSRSSTCSQTVSDKRADSGGGFHFALWVAFFEIYNECVYDLLQPSFCAKSRKRASLRMCDDGAGNAYVKDLRWINIHNPGEASKVLQFGNKNRSAAATKMNQSSSRSHSIFTMKLLQIEGDGVKRISEFSLCDLAGSERCNKTKTIGERLKEAGNINNSLLILGKCINALRNNQTDRMKSSYIPFRESKLTKLFQAAFCGRGRASMIVNINQCASTYDETLHVMKFSAVAQQVLHMIPDKPLASLAPCLVGRDGSPLMRNGLIDSQALESYLSEDELLDEEDEADMTVLPQNELVNMVESLRTKLLAERRRNLVQEMEIRKQMGDAMIQQLMEGEELRNRKIEELKESYQEKLENTFEMYKEAIKEHAYQCAMTNLEDNYVPLDEFTEEQEKVEALRCKVVELESRAAACPTPTYKQPDSAADDRYKRLYREKCALESMCEDKQELIVSLEKRLMDLTQTLQTVRDSFVEKAADLEDLEKKYNEQTKSLEEILWQNVAREREVELLTAEVAKLSQQQQQQPTVQPKVKRGLLANIKEAVTSPRRGMGGRALRKTTRNTHN